MENKNHYAEVPTPTPGREWRQMEERERFKKIDGALKACTELDASLTELVAVKADGQVILRFTESVASSKRSPYLLDLENHLKSNVDDSISVWLEALGDRNSLRNLRGIEVKT